MSDKGPLSTIHQELTQYQKKKENNPIKKTKNLNRHVFKKDIQMANRCMKRCSTSVITREMKIKTIMWHYLPPVRIAFIKKR